MKKEKTQEGENKQEETNLQKFSAVLFRYFVQEEKVSPEISHAVVSASYFQIITIVNIIILFTVFTNTNSSTYTIVTTSLCIILLIIDIFPKISKKHFVFYFISISQSLIIISIILSGKILLDNYFIFVSHCQSFGLYYLSRNYTIGPKENILEMCSTINLKFLSEIIVESVYVVGKGIHVYLYVRAYLQAKQKFDEDEKKRRRKDRYNQMIRRRYIFNQKRKV